MILDGFEIPSAARCILSAAFLFEPSVRRKFKMRLTNESVLLFVCSGVLLLSTHASLHGNGVDGGGLASALDNKEPLAQNADVIPINMLENHIYVNVRVNGSRPLRFILDTGA